MDEQLKCDLAVSAVVFGFLSCLLFHGQMGWLAAAAAGVGFGVILVVAMESLKNYMEGGNEPPVPPNKDQ